MTTIARIRSLIRRAIAVRLIRRIVECWLKGFHLYGYPPFVRPVRCANCAKVASESELSEVKF